MSHCGQRGMQILLVEDDKEVAESVADALAVLGHSVSHASSVVEALKLIDVTCPNVAVLDVDLGGGTSADVASVLNERSIPFVVATGQAKADTPLEMLGKPHLRKPYLIDDLERALDLACPGVGSIGR